MNVADALAEVELAIVEDRLGDATRFLEAIAQRLLESAPAPLELAHATWLAGAVALREGDERSFIALSRHAVEGLRLAGEDERMHQAIASRAELLEQLGDLQEVQERGAAGLMAVLDRQCARLLDIAASGGWHDPRWPLVNRQRALLPALVALVEATTGTPAPLARLIDELELDPVECALLATIAPLTHAGRPLRAHQLARTCFGDSRSHDEALLRLRDDARLARGRALVPTARGELALAEPFLTRLYALALIVLVFLGACGRINYDPIGDDDIDAADGDSGGPCPAGYTPLEESCYRVEATQRAWLAAEMDCEDDGDGSHLAIIVDVDEHFDLHAMAEAAGVGAESWLGYTDRITEGTFQWIAGGGLDPSLDECFFGPSGPTNNATLNCVVQQSTTMCGDWFVRDCAIPRPYICEHDGQVPVPGTF